jgi:protein-disulfide isomerase
MAFYRLGIRNYKPRRHYWRALLLFGVIIVALAYGWVSLGLFRKIFTINSNASNSSGEYVRTAESYPIETANRPTLGNLPSDLVIVEFTRYQCLECQAQSELIRQIVSLYDGRIRYTIRDYPDPADEWSVRLAEAVACANDQGKFWIMHDRMAVRPHLTDQTLLDSIAQGIGLDMASFKSCFDGRTHQEQVRQDIADGRVAGVTSTPSLFINGRLIKGPIVEAELFRIIDSIYPDLKSLHENLRDSNIVESTSAT